jgi:hypothetical protein
MASKVQVTATCFLSSPPDFSPPNLGLLPSNLQITFFFFKVWNTQLIRKSELQSQYLQFFTQLSIYLGLYNPFLGLGRFFIFLSFYIVGRTPLKGGPARRKAANCTQNDTNTEYAHTDIHASYGTRIQIFERAKTVHAIDSEVTCDRPHNLLSDVNYQTLFRTPRLVSTAQILDDSHVRN